MPSTSRETSSSCTTRTLRVRQLQPAPRNLLPRRPSRPRPQSEVQLVKLVKSAVPLLALGLALSGSAQTTAQSNGKVAVINVQAAVIGTKDGQKAANELTKRFGPRKDEFDKRNADIAQLQQQLGKATADD